MRLKALRAYPLLLLIFFSCQEGKFTVSARVDDTADAPPTYATFNGWTQIKAVGAKAPAAQASDIATAVASVTLSWNTMTSSAGTVASYNIYRSTTSGGQNYSAPLVSGITTAAKTYTDSSVTGGATYYYTVAPVLTDGTSTRPALTDSDREVKVIVPPANMILLHRWAANQDMCGEMGKTVDRSNNYRCAVATGGTAPPGTGGSGYLDLGQSIFIDAFEQGCNYTYDPLANKCGSADGCIGILSSPNGVVTGDNGNIYYSRRSATCYLNTSAGTGTTWVAANSTTAGNRGLMGSAAPGLPPFAVIDQPKSHDVCLGQTVSGFAGTKRLLKHRERILASAWDSSIADATITTMENGVNLDTTHHCNSNYASPQGNTTNDLSGTNPTIAYDNLALPAAKDTLPGCRFGDCASTVSTIRSVRTGSSATSSCVSKYGAQDFVGNVWEWDSDQISCTGAACTGVTSAVHAANDDFNGVAFDGTQGPVANGTFTSFGKIQFPIGIPIAGAGFTGDGTVTRTAAQFHGDYFWINVAASTRGAIAGGGWDNGSTSGRIALNLYYAPARATTGLGLRCALPAD
jgi:hypothetical protein